MGHPRSLPPLLVNFSLLFHFFLRLLSHSSLVYLEVSFSTSKRGPFSSTPTRASPPYPSAMRGSLHSCQPLPFPPSSVHKVPKGAGIQPPSLQAFFPSWARKLYAFWGYRSFRLRAPRPPREISESMRVLQSVTVPSL